jgi:rod shape-determining protein MreD
MKEFIQVTVGIILAFLIFLALKTISFSLFQLFNIFGLIVIYFAIRKGEIFGACLGAGCGLIQDAFSLGVFGVAGFSKTILGFLAGYIAKKIDVTPYIRNFFFILVLLGVDFILLTLLSSFIFSERLFLGKTLYSLQPLATAIFGSLLFYILGKFKYFSSDSR